MEDLSEPLLAEIVKRITRTSDLNSLSLVSKQLYTVEAEQRDAIRIGCGLHPATEASDLCQDLFLCCRDVPVFGTSRNEESCCTVET